ncbi:MAG: sugar phosphate nucleotidyltransferase [Patescibacteria group bacterium]
MNNMDHVYFVILAGGGGTRLWPKSRKKTPKQFLKLAGKDTMMQVTAQRVTQMVGWDHVIVVTNKDYLQEVKTQLPQVPEENIIAEPEKKDTALAMLTGTLLARTIDPQAIVANAASDHVITDPQEFVRVMQVALEVASERKNLVTVGITPTFPSSGFGYIKVGHDIKRVEGQTVFLVESFTEKPNVPTARAFISTGKYFWNANMYVWSADTLLEAFKVHKPDLFKKTAPIQKATLGSFHSLLSDVYKDAEAISIDYAISEKATNLVLIPGDFGWDDVGDWKVVYDLGKKDLAGNVVISDDPQTHTLTIESKNNLIHTNSRLIAMIGVENFTIIDTPEILMIVPKDRSQDVKKLVERLKEEKLEEYL